MLLSDLEAIGHECYYAGLEVHKVLGPGMLESAYHHGVLHEVGLRGLKAESEVPVDVRYKGVLLPKAYRIDILVEKWFPLEIKAVEVLLPKHEAQLLTYLKFGKFRIGFLMNFNEKLFKTGFRRIINGYDDE